MKIVIITGLSGSGKSSAIKYFEDMGYYCVDNIPPKLLISILDMPGRRDDWLEKIAFVIDIRGGELFNDLLPTLFELKEKKYKYEILFLEANDEVLVSRYKESRRTHPLQDKVGLLEGIRKERELLMPVREIASTIIDTSTVSLKSFKEKIAQYFKEEKQPLEMVVNVISFGFKHGIPIEADLVFDVRFIENPYYIKELRYLTGLDDKVKSFVLENEVTKTFLEKLKDLIMFLLPHYIDEGKTQLVIGIGCTGGHHRSVAISQEITEFLNDLSYNVFIEHRDIAK